MVLLVDQHTGLPHPNVTRYILSAMRPRGLSVNTMRAQLRAIVVGLEFLEERRIKWSDRVLGAQFLDYSEALALFERCRVDRRAGRRLINPTAAYYSYRSIIKFLIWLSYPVIGAIVKQDRQILVSNSLEYFKSMAYGLAANKPDQSMKEAKGLGLQDNQRRLFLAAIMPEAVENPFAPAQRYRNYALLMLQYHLGCREGEILGLKIRDIDFSATPVTVTIHRRHDDPEDPRRRQPVAKTRARLLEISDELAEVIRCWILHHRSDRKRYPLARKHPFLAVNRYGAPLSLRGYERVFVALRKQHPSYRRA